ncbi:choline transporter-like 1 isoform X3 [Pieris rapae]|uniref:choline transporter-like 1 isoform X3 n=1 Tax=Pieris rapae TaxID=64459 RepID=UPI001E27C7B5|nr:choline transporter-like 1 isoform X3 [Pieris rapae]
MGCAQSEIAPQNEQPKKGCTDVLWLVIYVIFWILMIIVAAIAFVYGNPQRLINGYDSFGNTCGVVNNKKLINFPLAGISTVDKPYLFFLDIKELRKSLKICVKKCPSKKMETFTDIQTFYKETGSNLCRYDINLNTTTNNQGLNNYLGPCPVLPVYESFPLLNRCFPKTAKEVAQKVFTDFYDLLNSWDTIEQMLSDLYNSWKEMIICVIIAFIFSLIMVSILHLLATLVSWIFMIVVSIVSVAGTVLLWYTYHELRTKQRDFSDSTAFLAESFKNEKAFLWYSIIATIITVILLLLVWVMRSRVSFLAALFKETAHCLGSIPALFLQPIITFFFLVLFFTFWSLVVVCLATANYPGIPYKTNFFINGSIMPDQIDNAAVQAQTYNESAKLKNPIEFNPMWVKSMWWMCLICLVWGSEFILGCQQMTIAGAVSHWYFRGTNTHPSPVMYSIGKLLKYHLGSVAKGSFLITLFKIPRLILTYLHAKLSSRAEKGSDCAKCGLKCGICCFYCLEKFIRYLNHNAYTIISIERCHFCKAAAKAFSTIVNNALQVATINSVGDFILFLGKCIVTALTGIIGLLLLKRNSDLHFFAVPTLVICIFSFFIAHCILSLYEMVVDSLFLCVCEDRNMNGDDGRWKNSRLAELGGHKADTAEMEDLQKY